MTLQELGEKREQFIKGCIDLGMTPLQARSDRNWKHFKHFCNTGQLPEVGDEGTPVIFNDGQNFSNTGVIR